MVNSHTNSLYDRTPKCQYAIKLLRKSDGHNVCGIVKLVKQKGLAPVYLLVVLIILVVVILFPIPYYRHLVFCIPTSCYQPGWKLGDPLWKKVYDYFYYINQPNRGAIIITPSPTSSPITASSNSDETANWKTYEGKNFLISYPENLNPVNKNYLFESVESVQFGERDKEKTGSVIVSVSLGEETLFKSRQETYLTYGMYNPEEEELLINGVKAWRFSGTDADGSNFRQYTLFYKNDLEFEIDNFGISKNTFNQILSTFKFLP